MSDPTSPVWWCTACREVVEPNNAGGHTIPGSVPDNCGPVVKAKGWWREYESAGVAVWIPPVQEDQWDIEEIPVGLEQAIIRSNSDVIRLVEAARAVTGRPMRGTLRPEPIQAWEDSQDWYRARLGDLRAALAPFEENAQ